MLWHSVETKCSTDLLDSLKEICFILNIPFTKPQRKPLFSVFDCLSIDMTLIDLLLLLHYEWIPSDFHQTYDGDIKIIFDKYELNEKVKAMVNTIQTKMKQKKLKHKSKERNEGITTKLFYELSTLLLNSNLFISILPLFKSFIWTKEATYTSIARKPCWKFSRLFLLLFEFWSD